MAVDGLWNVNLNTPMGAQALSLTLATEGSALSGSVGGGALAMTEFAGGTVDGDSLSWTVAITQPMALELEFSGTVDGDTISGKAKLGNFGEGAFEGARA
jgi:hypothetical protein